MPGTVITTGNFSYVDEASQSVVQSTVHKYYDRKLLENAKTQFVFQKYGQMRPIPARNGKRVEFRKWDLFDPNLAIKGLTEGVTPDSQDMSQTQIEAGVRQYGAYVEVSDLLDLTNFDDNISDSVELLGEQLGTVLEWVTRDELSAGTNVQYAGGSASRLLLTPASVLTLAEVKKAVRTLKKMKARKFGNGRRPHFICICGPDATYDLWNDDLWEAVAQYQNAEAIYDGEIGRMFGVVFVESTETKIFSPSVDNKVNAAVTAQTEFVLANEPTEAEVAYLSKGGNKIYVAGVEATLDATAPYTAATKTVKVTEAANFAKDAVVQSQDAGACDATSKLCAPIHASLIFGRDAYGIVDIAGSKAMKTIIHPHGHGDDALEQRATVGAKVMAFGVKRLNEEWIVRIEHGASA